MSTPIGYLRPRSSTWGDGVRCAFAAPFNVASVEVRESESSPGMRAPPCQIDGQVVTFLSPPKDGVIIDLLGTPSG